MCVGERGGEIELPQSKTIPLLPCSEAFQLLQMPSDQKLEPGKAWDSSVLFLIVFFFTNYGKALA